MSSDLPAYISVESKSADLNIGVVYILTVVIANYQWGEKVEAQVLDFLSKVSNIASRLIIEVKQKPKGQDLRNQINNHQIELLGIQSQIRILQRCYDRINELIKLTDNEDIKSELILQYEKMSRELSHFSGIQQALQNEIYHCNKLLSLIQS